jgi:hypothetical protein
VVSDLRYSHERVAFAEPQARITRRLRQLIGLDSQSMPTSHAAVRHGVSWSKARRAEHAFLRDWDDARPKRRPRHPGPDEIHLSKAQNFYTVLSDPVHGEVIGLARDRTEDSLAGLEFLTLMTSDRYFDVKCCWRYAVDLAGPRAFMAVRDGLSIVAAAGRVVDDG